MDKQKSAGITNGLLPAFLFILFAKTPLRTIIIQFAHTKYFFAEIKRRFKRRKRYLMITKRRLEEAKRRLAETEMLTGRNKVVFIRKKMITTNLLKSISALKQKKFRAENGLFVIEGRKMISELLHSDYKIQHICATKDWIATDNQLSEQIGQYSVQVIEVSQKDMERMSSQTTPDGVLAVVKIKDFSPYKCTAYTDYKDDICFDADKNLILAIDSINNPGNLGTIIRLATWFGIKAIVCSNETVDCFNPKTLQSTMGAIFHTKIIYTDLQEFLHHCQSANIYGTVLLNGKNVYKEQLTNNGIVVIGSESHGISMDLLKYINRPITIPAFCEDKDVESLNAGIACGIILSEFRRRML